MVRKILAILLLGACLKIYPQEQLKYEYWFDEAYSTRDVATAIKGNMNIDIDVSHLAAGIHLFNFRASDSHSRWTSPSTTYFLKVPFSLTENNILKYEYWIDDNATNRKIVSATTGSIVLDVDVASLESGIHLLNFRACDSRSRWTAPSTTFFLKAPRTKEKFIQEYEYWFDDRFVDRKMSSTSSGIINLDVDVTSLTDGVHTLTFRAKSSDGEWCAPSSSMFLKTRMPQAISVTKYEYWIDGNWDGKHMGENASGLIDIDIDISQLEAGMHCLYFRIQDQQGLWSAPLTHCFVKPSYMVGNKIKAYRYWFNGANDDATMVELDMPVSPLELKANLSIDNIRQHAATGDTILVTMDNGQQEKAVRNLLYMQFMDIYDQWSSVHVDEFATLIEKNLLNAKDLAILTELYQSTAGDSLWRVKWPALNQEIYSNELTGISTNNGRVTTINLKDNNLHGTFPDVVFGLDSLRVLNLEDNELGGELRVQAIPSELRELLLAGNRLSMLSEPVPATVNQLSLNRQRMDVVLPFQFSQQSLLTTFAQLPNICLYDQQQHTFGRNAKFTLNIEPNEDKPLAYMQMNEDQPVFWLNNNGKIVYTKQSGDTIYCYDDYSNRFMLTFYYDAGDANFDGQVNVLDLQAILNYMFEEYTNNPYNFGASDLWKDEQINVQDVIRMVSLLMEKEAGDTEHAANLRRIAPASESANNATVYVQNRQLTIDTSEPVAAFDIIISGGNNMNVVQSLKQAGMTISTNTTSDGIHIIGYSLNGACIPAGTTVIGMLDQTASVRKAMLSDKEACAICVTHDGNTTGINTIDLSDRNNPEVYDLQGRKVNTIQRKGIYIKNGHKIVK